MKAPARWLAAAAVLIVATAWPAAAATETPVVTGSQNQLQPAAGSGGLAWTVRSASSSALLADVGGGAFPVSPNAASASGGIDGDRLVYQRVGTRDSDIIGYDLASTSTTGPVPHVNSRFWEYSPTVSGDWVLFNRNNINYGMAKEWERVILVNTDTGAHRVLAQAPPTAFLNAGQVNGNWATWEVWTRTDGFRAFRYNISADRSISLPGAGPRDPYAPAVAPDGTAYYMVSGAACGRNVAMLRRTPDGATSVIHSFPTGTDAWDLYEYTDGIAQDVYYSRINCATKDWRGDIYRIDNAEAAAPISTPGTTEPEVSREAQGTARPRPVLPVGSRAAQGA